MYCKNCGEEMNANQAICLKCGVGKDVGNSFCENCGNAVGAGAAVCLKCGASLTSKKDSASGGKLTKSKEKKLICGVHSGLGKKFGCSPWIFRILHLILHFVVIGFLIDIIYIIAAITMPNEE
ncbi:MAG: PspC domain-containing protein [Clostridia bacterium]|nr:PspC domain-containing protein [Clostridia bacterium]